MSYYNDEQAPRDQAAWSAQWAGNSSQPQNLAPYQTSGTSSNPNQPINHTSGTVPMNLLNSPSSHSIPGLPHNPAPVRMAYQSPIRQQDSRSAVSGNPTYDQGQSSRGPPGFGFSAQPSDYSTQPSGYSTKPPNYNTQPPYARALPNPASGPSGSQTAQANPYRPMSDPGGRQGGPSNSKKEMDKGEQTKEERIKNGECERCSRPAAPGKKKYSPNPIFRLDTIQLSPLREEQILVKVLYISNNAGILTFIGCTVGEDRMYVPPIKIGDHMHSGVIGRVLESNSVQFKPGDLVMEQYRSLWCDKIILDTDTVQHIAPLPNNLFITHYLGAFGGSGLAGYVGLLHIAQAKPEHTIVTAVKLLGAKRVVGIAGGEEKCAWVGDYLGANACVEYKSPKVVQYLKEVTPDEVDISFDNVGGSVLDCVLTRMKKFRTITVYGAMSTYNSDTPTILKNWFKIISQRLTLKGFFLFNHMDKIPDGMD
ncbi:endo-polygalacturonase 6 [Fusarium sp. NRRL 52700]|nr:endo-polygalacturonase 6 [Fusarium sp. NRRL 52700]